MSQIMLGQAWDKVGTKKKPGHISGPRENKMNRVLPLVDRRVFQVAGADVFGTRTDQFVVGVLLENMTGPTRNSRDGKNRRVKVERNAHQVIGRRRVKIYVREHSLFLVHELLDPLRHLIPFHLTLLFAHMLRIAAKPCGTWVFRLVDSVADAHDL